MAFSICFTHDPDVRPFDEPSDPAATGRIVHGATSEAFLASLGEWDRKTYEAQWKQSLLLFLQGQRKAVLLTTYGNPSLVSHLECWILYRDGSLVYIQNHLLFYDDMDKTFSPDTASQFVRDRETADEDGTSVSEWSVPFSDVQSFVESIA